jgi:hypothetical protein
MEGAGNRRGTPKFALSVERGDDASAVATTIVATWRDIDAALAPIIGGGGVAALYRRSVYVTAIAHPSLSSLSSPHAHLGGAIDLPALSAALARQDLVTATAAGDALLQAFADLVGTLIGPALAERLLAPVWSHFPSGSAAQDPTP